MSGAARAGRDGYHTSVEHVASLHGWSSRTRTIAVEVCRHRDGAVLPHLVVCRRPEERGVDVTLPADSNAVEQIVEALRIGVATAIAAQTGAPVDLHRADDRILSSREVYSSTTLRLFVETTRHPSGRVLPRLRGERAWDGAGNAVSIPLDALDDVLDALREAADAAREIRARSRAEEGDASPE